MIGMDSAPPSRVTTSTASPGIENACALLATVAAAPTHDLDAALTASEVIYELSNVIPPLPPMALPEDVCADASDVDGALAAAIEELSAVTSSTADAREALRAGHAVHALRALRTRRVDPDTLVYPAKGPR